MAKSQALNKTPNSVFGLQKDEEKKVDTKPPQSSMAKSQALGKQPTSVFG